MNTQAPAYTGTAHVRRRGRNVCLLFGVIIVGLLSASGSSAAPSAAAKPILRIAINVAANYSLDPTKGYNLITTLAYEPLLHEQPNGTIVAGLAQSWRFYNTGSGPNKNFTLTLRHSARFSDGTQVTAADVVNWFKYVWASGGQGSAELNQKQTTFSIVGKWTVQIHLETPDPDLPSQLCEYLGSDFSGVASPKFAADPSLFTNATDGAGPYMLDPSRSVAGDHYTYIPNPHYYDPSAIKWSEIDAKNIPSASATLQALTTGQVNASAGDLTTYQAAKAAGLNISWTRASTYMLVLDRSGATLPALKDIRVRQALNYAINRTKIVKTLLPGALATSAAKTLDGYNPKAASYYSYNPAKAKALLAAAGYAKGLTIDTFDEPGLPPSYDAVLSAMASDLAAVGVTLKVTVPPSFGSWLTGFTTAPAVVLLNGGLPTVSQYQFWWSPSASALNPRHVDTPAIDKAYVKGLKSTNATKYWQEISLLSAEDAYLLPVANPATPFYSSKKIGGVAATNLRPVYLVPEWYPKS